MIPSISILSPDEIEAVHRASLRILERAGTKVDHEEARHMLLEAGCEEGRGDDVILIPTSLVESCLGDVPSKIYLTGRGGRRELVLGGGHTHFNPGSAAMFIEDHETYDMRSPTRADLEKFVTLTDALDSMAMQSTALVLSDVPEGAGDLLRLLLVLRNSDKPVVTGAFHPDGVGLMSDMLEVVARDVDRGTVAIFDVCPSPPLIWSHMASQNLLDCAELDLPAQVVTMPELGATGPATLAGSVVQGNAEFLTAAVISQLRRKGAPLIFGGSSTTFDMRFATPRLGAIETAMSATALNQMGKHYGVPTHAYLGLSDSKIVDAQAGLETALGAVVGVLAGIDNISGPGMLSTENCQSMEKLVIDNDICGQALRLKRGLRVDEETLAEEVLEEQVPGGNYLSTKHTLDWFRTETFFPSEAIDRQTLKRWREAGSKDAGARASNIAEDLIREHEPVRLDDDLDRELVRVVKEGASSRGVGPSLLGL